MVAWSKPDGMAEQFGFTMLLGTLMALPAAANSEWTWVFPVMAVTANATYAVFIDPWMTANNSNNLASIAQLGIQTSMYSAAILLGMVLYKQPFALSSPGVLSIGANAGIMGSMMIAWGEDGR